MRLKKSLRFPNPSQPSQCPCCDYFVMTKFDEWYCLKHASSNALTHCSAEVSATASSHYCANVNFICLHNDPLHPQRAAAKPPLMVVVLACHGWNPVGLGSLLIEVRVRIRDARACVRAGIQSGWVICSFFHPAQCLTLEISTSGTSQN